VDLISGDGSPEGVTDEDAEQVAVRFVAHNLRVRLGRAAHVDPCLIRTAGHVGGDPRPGRIEGEDPVLPVVYKVIVRELGIASTKGENAFICEVLDREADDAHVFDAFVDLAVVEVHVAEHADARRTAGRAHTGGGRDHSVVEAAKRDPILADHDILTVKTGYEYGVTWIRSIDSPLDRLTRSHNALRPRRTDTTD
jgi:hypothetical protein